MVWIKLIMEWTKLILENIVQIIHYMAWPIVALIGLCFFKKDLRNLINRIKEVYHGDNGIVFSTNSEPGGSKKPTIPAPESIPELTPEAKKILATLWQRQKHHFGDDFTGRWSFRVLPNSEVYGTFMVGFAELLKFGLVGWTRKDGQAQLTKNGIEYIRDHTDIQNSTDVYIF